MEKEKGEGGQWNESRGRKWIREKRSGRRKWVGEEGPRRRRERGRVREDNGMS